MKFSFVIPVFNTQDYLEDCISSILNQTYGDFEIILIDDGSTDNSAEICKRLANDEARINFKCVKNGGPARIRNIGINESSGDYIWFVDSDDKLSSDIVLYELNEILSSCNADMLFFLSNNYDEKLLTVIKGQSKYKFDKYVDISGEDLITLLKTSEEIVSVATSPVNKIFKRSLLKNNSLYFVEKFRWHAEDEFLNKVISNASGFYFLNDELYQVRIRPKSITTTINYEILEKKIYTKVELADMCLHYFDNQKFKKEFQETIITYYSYYFLFAFHDYYQLTSREQKKRIKNFINERKFIFKQMRHSFSRNLRLLAKIYKIFGLTIFMKLVKIRYKF